MTIANTNKGISFHCYIPVRREPSHFSEMVSQLLFGETCKILDSKKNWSLISIDFDKFEGWVEKDCIYTIGPEYESQMNSDKDHLIVYHPAVTVKVK